MKKTNWIRPIAGIILLGYIAVLFKVIILKHMPMSLFIEAVVESPVLHLLPRPFEQCNFVPLKTIQLYIDSYGLINRDIIINNLFGNVLLFTPLGMLMKLYFVKRPRVWALFLMGVLLSFSFEIMQYISGVGVADIDDVILNAFGLALGLPVGMIINHWIYRKKGKEETYE
jgi:glycopeptide antibiotics resistance protein